MTTTIEITKAAVKDPEARRALVEEALRTELDSRGIRVGKYVSLLDGVSVGFRIGTMDAYQGSTNYKRLSVTLGEWGSKKSYSEPIKTGFDIPEMADRMIALLKEVKEDQIRLANIRAREEASRGLEEVIRGEFPDLAYQFNGCGAADNVKLNAQYLTLEQAREVAVLLMKIKAEKE